VCSFFVENSGTIRLLVLFLGDFTISNRPFPIVNWVESDRFSENLDLIISLIYIQKYAHVDTTIEDYGSFGHNKAYGVSEMASDCVRKCMDYSCMAAM
jgi:hypothetical protein